MGIQKVQPRNTVRKNNRYSKEEGVAFFKPCFRQPKLTINQPGDVYEQEADAMADKVMRMPDPAVSNHFFFKPAISSVQRKCSECEEAEKQVLRKENNSFEIEDSVQTENYISSLSGGTSLSKNERSFFEPRLGYDFSKVKIHTGSVATKSAQSINALAYTSGNNVVFNEGQYAPHTDGGKRLLGHELTHVIQQQSLGSIAQRQPTPGSATSQGPVDRAAQIRHTQLSQLLSEVRGATRHSMDLRSSLDSLVPASSPERDTLTTQLNEARNDLILLLHERIPLLQIEINYLNRQIGPEPSSSPENPRQEALGFELIDRENELRSHEQQLRPLLRVQTRQRIAGMDEEIAEIDGQLALLPQVSSPDDPTSDLLFDHRAGLVEDRRKLVASLTSTATEYKQFDRRWGAIRYGNSPNCTNLKEGGCGPTSLAMVLNYLFMEDPEALGDSGQIEFVTPPQTATYAATHGRVCNSGTAGDTMVTNVHTQWPGFIGSRVSLAEGTDQVRAGNLVIFLCHSCTGLNARGQNRSYGGHYMVLSGVNEEGTVFNVLDSGSNESRDIETISVRELRTHTAGFWIVERK